MRRTFQNAMAIEIIFRKLRDSFVPVDKANLEIMEQIKLNAVVRAVITQPRNIKFHNKLFALLRVAFDAWYAPDVEYNGQKITKNFDSFRRELTIRAGFYETHIGLEGEVYFEPRSISFAKMDETEFEQLYSRYIDVILEHVLTHYTRDDLDYVVEQVLGFA